MRIGVSFLICLQWGEEGYIETLEKTTEKNARQMKIYCLTSHGISDGSKMEVEAKKGHCPKITKGQIIPKTLPASIQMTF